MDSFVYYGSEGTRLVEDDAISDRQVHSVGYWSCQFDYTLYLFSVDGIQWRGAEWGAGRLQAQVLNVSLNED